MFRRGWFAVVGAVLALPTLLVSLPASAGESVPGVTAKTITIGLITSQTGLLASSFADAAGGAIARIRLQNAEGGVDGRQIKLVVKDDQSSPQQNELAAEEIDNSQVFGVVEDTGVDLFTDKVLNAANVPETSWVPSPIYRNDFSFEPEDSLNATSSPAYDWTYWGKFMKSIGVTKLAGVTYSLATQAVTYVNAAAKLSGISNCYNDTSVTLGAVDFTAAVLSMKRLGCNGLYSPMVESSNVGLATGLRQGGVSLKAIYGTGYDQVILSDVAGRKAINGAYFDSYINMTTSTPALRTMLGAIKKYDPNYKGGLPDYGTWTTYASMDLMIKGLEFAGKNPTRSSFVTNLRKVGSYNANGLFPASVSFRTFGTPAMVPKSSCMYFIQLKGSKFVSPNGGKAWCGGRFAVPGT
jgi:branched-chain amino acid transport system substrate-binding protein